MTADLRATREHFIQGMSRISSFWGFPRAMGAIFGAIYLSPDPLSLDELVEQVGVTKGAISTNVRQLERLGIVHQHIQLGSRKDFYTAETDFWRITKGILREREQSEFDAALNTVGESLEMLDHVEGGDLGAFYKVRLGAVQGFFQTLDSVVSTLLKLEHLVSLNAVQKILSTTDKS